MIAGVYEHGVRQGKFISGHGMAYADILWAVFTGLVLLEEAKRKIDPGKDYFKPTLYRAFDIFLNGIKKI